MASVNQFEITNRSVASHSNAWSYELLDIDSAPWAEIESTEDHTFCKSHAWMRYIARSKGAEPIIARLSENGVTKGYFLGGVMRRFGQKFIGSPFPGWTTAHMGINALTPDFDRGACYRMLLPALNREFGSMYTQCIDWKMTEEEAIASGIRYRYYNTQVVDLSVDEDKIFANMGSACRRAVRKGIKNKLTIVEAEDKARFCDDYYDQLEDVFAKQSLVPTYSRDRAHALVEELSRDNLVLLLEARDQDGNNIATGIFPGANRFMEFWGGASWRPSQHLRPNELLFFEAMKIWKSRGVTEFDLGGYKDYKNKFGPAHVLTPRLQCARWEGVHYMIDQAKNLHKLQQRVRGAVVN